MGKGNIVRMRVDAVRLDAAATPMGMKFAKPGKQRRDRRRRPQPGA